MLRRSPELRVAVVPILWRYVVFGDAVVATAILDRLLHHSHVITIRGDSYRLREKRRTGLLKAPAIAPSVPAQA